MENLMRKNILTIALVISLSVSALAAANSYHLLKTVVVAGAGGWDYLTVDDINRRLYISHETQVDVLDADSGTTVGKILNTPGVHGIAIAQELNRGFTTNGKSSSVTIFDLKTLATLGQIPTGKKPDAIVFDPATQRVFAMNGEGDSSTAIDAATGKVVGTIDLGGGPEFATADGVGNVYVNLEDNNQTLRIDSHKLTVKDRWGLAPCKAPSSMAIDRETHRLFIGCRSHVMAVVNSDTGKVVTTLPIGDHVDATAFDAGTSLIFNSTGEGVVYVFHEDSPDKYSALQQISTRPGSKTMALDPKTHKLFIPATGSGGMEVLLFGW
jgi:DNA-binding beta-propeller fold protein YncE